ncbi:hypothetical protein TNCV_2585951 [Trichonephila clavipes]|nr:hypothetical protein TNCV_2585951 [Trichonephila clavipes]
MSPHKSLNTSRGVISKPELLSTPEAEILDGFSDQRVIQFSHSLLPLRQTSCLPHLSSIKLTTQIESRLPEPISASAAAPDNSLNISTSSSSAETWGSAAYQCRSAACLALSSKGLSTTLLASPARDTNWAVERTLAAEELRVSLVTALRNALPKAVPEDEELGCGWLGGGDSLISRNPPWLWTVPGSTLWVFPRCLALKNPQAVTLGTLEKCGNSWPGGGHDETGRNPCSQKNGDNQRE